MPRRSTKVLTDRRVRSLKPKTTTYEVTDARLPGFGVRVTPYGLKTFFFRFPSNGQRRRMGLGVYDPTCCGDLARARRKAEVARGRIANGEALRSNSSSNGAPTFGTVARRWIEEYSRPRKKTWKYDQNMLAKDVLPAWENTPIDSIQPLAVRRLLLKIAKRSGSVANRVQIALRALFNWSIEEGLLNANPAAIRRVHREEPPKTVLSDRDMATLWSFWTQTCSLTGAALCLYLLTGLRNAELRKLQWSQVQDNRFELARATTKNGEPHTVYLPRQALPIVDAIRSATGDYRYMFPSTKKQSMPTSGFARQIDWIRDQCDTEYWSIQALRRTASTILAREDVEPIIIDVFLNHVVGDVTHRHYVRYRYAKQVEKATQILADAIERRVGPMDGFAVDGFNYGNTRKTPIDT